MQTDEADNGNISESDYNGHEPETEHRTDEKPAGALHGALEKIIRSVSSYLRHNKKNTDNAEPDSDYDESEPEETGEYAEDMEEDEEYAKAKYYMLTREERCHLKAQREMERLSRKSPAFSQCLVSCVQTPIRDGIAIGCPNVPIYRLVKACTEDTQYLFPVYEP